MAELHVAISRDTDEQVEDLKIAVCDLSQPQQAFDEGHSFAANPHLNQRKRLERVSAVGTPRMSQIPLAIDGLRVLVVDDETDAREFIIAVLNSYGLHAKSVASAAEALEELGRFRPDVLLSDIRMPDGDGYSLIRQIRALEANQGGHLPAAAMTAYLDEDREKALKAGFEAHLHKLAQPTVWVDLVTQLANQASR